MLIGVGLVLDEKDVRCLLIPNTSQRVDPEVLLMDVGRADLAGQGDTVPREQSLYEHSAEVPKCCSDLSPACAPDHSINKQMTTSWESSFVA